MIFSLIYALFTFHWFTSVSYSLHSISSRQYIHTGWQQRQRSLRVDHLVDLSLGLWLHQLMEFDSWARTNHASYEGDNGEAVTVADLDHETIRVVEEELVHLDLSFFHFRPHIVYLHFLKLLLHCSHTFALHFHN